MRTSSGAGASSPASALKAGKSWTRSSSPCASYMANRAAISPTWRVVRSAESLARSSSTAAWLAYTVRPSGPFIVTASPSVSSAATSRRSASAAWRESPALSSTTATRPATRSAKCRSAAV